MAMYSGTVAILTPTLVTAAFNAPRAYFPLARSPRMMGPPHKPGWR